jgi:hypothetical protein
MFLFGIYVKSLIQAKLGDKRHLKTAMVSLANATKSKNDYVKMNSESIAEWVKNKLSIQTLKAPNFLGVFFLSFLFYWIVVKYK